VPRFMKIDPHKPSPELLMPAIEIIRTGGVVAYPTETFYGLGVDAFSSEAIKRIYSIKKRELSLPLLILIPNAGLLGEYAEKIPDIAWKLIKQFWPGPLTIVFSASPKLPSILTARTKKIAIRMSSHPIARLLTEEFHGPITSTSANITGLRSPVTSEEVFLQLGNNLEMIIDGGATPGGTPSTIVDVTTSPPRMVREGIIPFSEIKSLFPATSL